MCFVNMSDERRERRRAQRNAAQRKRRAKMSNERRQFLRQQDAARHARRRACMSEDERRQMREADAARHRASYAARRRARTGLTGLSWKDDENEIEEHSFGAMDQICQGIKQEAKSEDDFMTSRIPSNFSYLAIEEKGYGMMSCSDEGYATLTTFPGKIHIKQEGSLTTQDEDASVTPFPTMDNKVCKTVSFFTSKVKTEPASEEELDCEQTNTVDFIIKREIIEVDTAYDCLVKDEVHSGEEGSAISLPDAVIVKFEKDDDD